MLPHPGRLAAAIAVILPFHAWAQADAVKVAPGDHQTDAAPVRQGGANSCERYAASQDAWPITAKAARACEVLSV